MKKLIVVLTLLIVTGMLVACDTGTNSNQTELNQEFRGYLTLQGKIMDALTGAGVGGSDLQVFLIQGLSDRRADKLVTDTNNVLVGEYAFANIPVYADSTNGVGGVQNEVTFKVVVVKGGYQRFEAQIGFDVTPLVAGAGNDTYNTTFNRIGNIYLFPTGSSAGDVDVYVYSPQNIPVPGATVHLVQNTTNNEVHVNIAGDRLTATNGLVTNLTSSTDTTGKATFAGSTLTLGGSYDITVESITFQGQKLAFYNPVPSDNGLDDMDFITGTDSSTQRVTLANIDDVLYAVSASNEVPSTITPDGALTITFNQPIKLSTTTFGATVTAPGTLTAATYTGVLSSNDTILTLTPAYGTTPTAAGSIVTWTYGGTISLPSSQTNPAYTLFGGGNDVVNIKTNAAVSGDVHVVAD